MRERIFISYARSDERTAVALAGHLRQLETAGNVGVWFDGRLEIGESWERRILDEVRRSDIILLLVSPNYLASRFVVDYELPLIEEIQATGARVVPVIVAPCAWRSHRYIGSLQAFDHGRELKAPTTITFGRHRRARRPAPAAHPAV